MKLARKKVLITGGTRGIGRALAELLALEGCEVMVCGRDEESLHKVQRDLGVRGVVCDVSCAKDVAKLESVVRGELCGLDILINNAGVQYDHDVTAGLDELAAEREIAFNLMGPIFVTSALMPLLLSSPEAVVANLSSGLAYAPSPRSPVYAASKAGLSMWTHALRMQLAETGVRVVEVLPPLAATEMTKGRHEDAAPPADVANAIVAGLRSRRECIAIGKVRTLMTIHRLSPKLARRIMSKR